MTVRQTTLLLVLLGLVGCAATPKAVTRHETGIFIRDGASKQLRLQHETTAVPAVVGSRFGISYVLAGPAPQPGAGVVHSIVWRFPGGGLVLPKGVVQSDMAYGHACAVGATCHAVWHFTDAWELVPGSWTVELWHEGRQIDRQVFNVQRPLTSSTP